MQLRIPPWSIVSVNDETAFRAIDGTVYTNTTGKTMFVDVSTQHTNGANAASSAYNLGYVAGMITADEGISSGLIGLVVIGQMTLKVSPGATYKVLGMTGGTGINALQKWIESY